MPAVFNIFPHIFFLDPQHNVKESPADPGVCDLPRFQEVTELPVIEEVVELRTDAVRQLPGDIHIAREIFRLFVEQLLFQDQRKVVLADRVLDIVIVAEQFQAAGGDLFAELREYAGKRHVFKGAS